MMTTVLGYTLTKKICKYVVTYHHGDGEKEPKESLKYVLHDQVSLGAKHEQSDVSPAKLREGVRVTRSVSVCVCVCV